MCVCVCVFVFASRVTGNVEVWYTRLRMCVFVYSDGEGGDMGEGTCVYNE